MWIPLLGLPVGIIFGVLVASQNASYSQLLLLGLASLGLGFARIRVSGSSRHLMSLLLLVLTVASGWHWGALDSRDLSRWQLSSDPYFIRGTVDGVPVQRFYGQQVRIRLDCVGSRPGQCDQYHRIWWQSLWRHRPSVEISLPEDIELEPGTRIQLSARFRPLETKANPGAFDSERWMLSNHLVARFSLIPGAEVEVLSRTPVSMDRFRATLQRYLQHLRDLEPRPQLSGYAVLLALISGDRSLMTDRHWDIFNRTGTTHLVAISGLHIGLVAAFVTFISMPWFRRWVWFTNRYPAAHGAIVVAWLVALSYAAVAGFALPAQRAIIMLTVLVCLKLLGRVQQLWLGLSLAFCLTLVWDPVSCLSLGFWLSYSAVYLIIWVAGSRVVTPPRTWLWIRVQFALMFGLAPVLLWQVQAASLVSILTNLIAVPLVGFLIVPMALIWASIWALLGWSVDMLLQWVMTLIGVLLWMLERAAQWNWSVWAVGEQHWFTVLPAIVGVLWLLSKGVPGRLWGGILFLPLLMPQTQAYGLYVLQADDLQMAMRLPDRVLFVSASHWPQIVPKWHKALLQQWGVPVPETVIPVQAGAALWQASGLVATEYRLQQNWLGQPSIAGVRFVDLCATEQPLKYDAVVLASQSPPNGQKYCDLQWILGNQRGLYWPTESVRSQAYLLKHWRTLYSRESSVDAGVALLVLNKKVGAKIDPKLDKLLDENSQIVMAGKIAGNPWLLQKEHERRIHSLDQRGYYFYPLQKN